MVSLNGNISIVLELGWVEFDRTEFNDNVNGDFKHTIKT